MTVFLTPGRRAVLRGHVLPATAAPRLAVVHRGPAGGRADLAGAARGRADGRPAPGRRPRGRAERPSGAGRGRPPGRGRARRIRAGAGRDVRPGPRRIRGRAEVPAVDGVGVPAAPPRAHRGRRRPRDGRADVRGDGPRRDLRPAGRRLRALLRRRRLGGPALREDAVRQRVARPGVPALVAGHRPSAGPADRGGDLRLPGRRPAHRGGRLRLGARRRQRGRGGAPLRCGPRRSWPRCSAPRTGRGRRRCSGSPRTAPSSTARRCCSCPPTRTTRSAGTRCAAGCSRRARCASSRAATTRWSRPGTAWRSRRWPRPGPCSGAPDLVEAAEAAADLLVAVHLGAGEHGDRLVRVSLGGVAGAHAGVLEDHADVAEGLLALYQCTGEEEWLAFAGVLLDVVLAHFADGHGGFLDTADDAEALVARPAGPHRQRHPLGLDRRGAGAAHVRGADRQRAAPGGRRAGARRRPGDRAPAPAVDRLGAGGGRGRLGRPARGGRGGRRGATPPPRPCCGPRCMGAAPGLVVAVGDPAEAPGRRAAPRSAAGRWARRGVRLPAVRVRRARDHPRGARRARRLRAMSEQGDPYEGLTSGVVVGHDRSASADRALVVRRRGGPPARLAAARRARLVAHARPAARGRRGGDRAAARGVRRGGPPRAGRRRRTGARGRSRGSRWTAGPSTARPTTCWWRPRRGPACWSSRRAGTAASSEPCSARPRRMWCSTRTARWSCSGVDYLGNGVIIIT